MCEHSAGDDAQAGPKDAAAPTSRVAALRRHDEEWRRGGGWLRLDFTVDSGSAASCVMAGLLGGEKVHWAVEGPESYCGYRGVSYRRGGVEPRTTMGSKDPST